MTVDRRVLDDVIDTLIGQCHYDLEAACEQHDVDFNALTPNDIVYIDERVFLCESCGWWCPADEAGHSDVGLYCDECKPESDQ